MASIRKDTNGKYRVWCVWKKSDSTFEVRYATRTLAKDYTDRRGGYIGWEEFDSKESAEAFLAEKQGEIWW